NLVGGEHLDEFGHRAAEQSRRWGDSEAIGDCKQARPRRQMGQGAVNAYPRVILTRSGLKGRSRSLLPVACAKALAMAATVGPCEPSPEPSGLSFGRSINSTSIFGTSGMVRIG